MNLKDLLLDCESKHNGNSSLEYHQCVCSYVTLDPTVFKKFVTIKLRHCNIADEMRKMGDFEFYLYIGFAVIFVIIFLTCFLCSCKWYIKTKTNPCSCCTCLCCSHNNKNLSSANGAVIHGSETCSDAGTHSGSEDHSHGVCMNFCLSEPVQDCCEFFDCDLMWRKKNVYSLPVVGRKKNHFQRRPTRPAPPPPKVAVIPVVKNPVPVIDSFHNGYDFDNDVLSCEPVPEAPPSPEPLPKNDQPRAMYVDPLSFLQRPFLKMSKDKSASSGHDSEDLYSRVKDFVLRKKKSSSVMSLSKRDSFSISADPTGGSSAANQLGKMKCRKTSSLASLQNISDDELNKSYSSKRSLSLASLSNVDELDIPVKGERQQTPYAYEDDTSFVTRRDEYIDLEEMTKRIEAKTKSAQLQEKQHTKLPSSSTWTPSFIPASAFPSSNKEYQLVGKSNPHASHCLQLEDTEMLHKPIPTSHYSDSQISADQLDMSKQTVHYCPPVPAAGGKPAVPARTFVGAPVCPVTPNTTLGRVKPTVPPRPYPADSGNFSPKSITRQPAFPCMQRPVGLVKPQGPPPLPPSVPIESAI